MKNIEYYKDYNIKEDLNFKYLKKRIKIETLYISIVGLAGVFYTIFFWIEGNKYKLPNFLDVLKKTRQIMLFFHKHSKIMSELIKSKNEIKIKEYLENMCTEYEYKYKRSFIDDLIDTINNSTKFNPPKNKKDMVVYEFWIKILNGVNLNKIDIDPYGEEDWNEEYEVDPYAEYFKDEKYFIDRMKELLLNKKILFISYTDKQENWPDKYKYYENKLKTLIYVKDLFIDETKKMEPRHHKAIPNKIIFIDNEGIKYNYQIKQNNIITVLNEN